MIIHENAWSVGSLSAGDPNAQSFRSPNGNRSGCRGNSRLDAVPDEQDVAAIETQAAYRTESNSATEKLGNAIAFNQAQDAFLKKVQESLQRMNELTALVQAPPSCGGDWAAYATEFTQLQDRIKDIESKMFKAENWFQTSDLELGFRLLKPAAPMAPPATRSSIDDVLENTTNPKNSGISDAAGACVAGGHITRALGAVTEMRAKVGRNLQRLCLTGERIFACTESLSNDHILIKDINVAEASTEFARFDMLTQSGKAMLAQANALPESALRLLN